MLGVLENFYKNQDTTLLGVRKKDNKLVTIKKADLTFLNLIKCIFGQGPRAGVTFRLKKVNQHLLSDKSAIKAISIGVIARKDNSIIYEKDGTIKLREDTPQLLHAYKAVCVIANKVFIKNPKDRELFEAISFKYNFDVILPPCELPGQLTMREPTEIGTISLYQNPEQDQHVLEKQLNLSRLNTAFEGKMKELFDKNKPEQLPFARITDTKNQAILGFHVAQIADHGTIPCKEHKGLLKDDQALVVPLYNFSFGIAPSSSSQLHIHPVDIAED